MTESTSWQDILNPLLNILNKALDDPMKLSKENSVMRETYLNTNIESWGDNTTLVDAASQFNNNLSRAVVIDDFELSDVA
jgi:hypothetical protein